MTARGGPLARALLLAAAAFAAAAPAAGENSGIRVRTIERFRGAEEPADRLAFRGGLVLSGPRGFGGFSGLLVDGADLLAVSDVGQWLTARMVLEDGRLVGLEEARLIPRRDVDGREITLKRIGDAEALARAPDGIVVAVEQAAQLLHYRSEGLEVDWAAPARRIPIDHPLRVAARRDGIEGLVRLAGGALLAFTENARDGLVAAFRVEGGRIAVNPRGEWAVTGADALPGGDIVLVERRWRGGADIAMRVRRIGSDALRGSRPLDGPVLLEAGFSAEIDNMEAVAAEVVDGRIVLTFMSDDNLSFWQRTLLLRFEVADPVPRANPARGDGPS